MDFRLVNKCIFILSPEKWGNMRFSKHHYALELAELGNKVFFIEPPDLKYKGIQIVKAEENDLLNIVSYKPVYRGKRFLPAFIYRQLIKLQVSLLIRKTGSTPDLVICFDPFRFLNLKWFGAAINIFFLADLLPKEELPEEVLTADFSLCLSESRMIQLRNSPKPVYFINHGLSRYYVDKSKHLLSNLAQSVNINNQEITAGYIGNLLMGAADRRTMIRVIQENPQVKFIFWGQYEKLGQLVAYENTEVDEFINFLKTQSNVILRGPVHPEFLSEEVNTADLLWVCWDLSISKVWDGSNPHKILEYLSTGKPLITHYIDTYKSSPLIDMMKDGDNTGYPALFNSVLARIKKGESTSIQKKRIEFAIDNSYSSQIKRIEAFINKKAESIESLDKITSIR